MDTVYALKDKLTALEKEHKALRKEFMIEKEASQHLRNILKHNLLPNRTDIKWELEP